jgi:2-amino-4-hydroxy-6-hydroxymethyldihydropteridine diphosphokinase
MAWLQQPLLSGCDVTHAVYLALGSNLGDRLQNLRSAVGEISSKLHLVECSGIYETPPWGYSEQPAFLNMALKAETDLDARPLLDWLKELEHTLGRVETFRFGPRVIDLDILFFDDITIKTEWLEIPHPRLQERAFVLAPLAEIAPDLQHPSLHLSVAQMLAGVDVNGITRVAAPPVG